VSWAPGPHQLNPALLWPWISIPSELSSCPWTCKNKDKRSLSSKDRVETNWHTNGSTDLFAHIIIQSLFFLHVRVHDDSSLGIDRSRSLCVLHKYTAVCNATSSQRLNWGSFTPDTVRCVAVPCGAVQSAARVYVRRRTAPHPVWMNHKFEWPTRQWVAVTRPFNYECLTYKRHPPLYIHTLSTVFIHRERKEKKNWGHTHRWSTQ